MSDITHKALRIARECTCLRVRQASRVLTRAYDEKLRGAGIRVSQLAVLVAVSLLGEEGATIGALADALVMDPSTVTRNVKPLEKAGLVRVARSPDDGRTRLVLLTLAGERTLEAAYSAWLDAQSELEGALGGSDVARLRQSIEGLLATRKPKHVEGRSGSQSAS